MHFTVEAQRIVANHLRAGDVAIDATAGNGHDTLFLANAVGPKGKIYAIDIQPQAIERLRQTLSQSQLLERVELFVENHAILEQLVAPKLSRPIDCVMFNLGYLPHSDKSVTTQRESTLPGIEGAFHLLRLDGMMTILAYVGHDGGRNEADGVSDWLESRNADLVSTRIQDSSNPASPILWIVQKRIESRLPFHCTDAPRSE